jgi:hypothetical protein
MLSTILLVFLVLGAGAHLADGIRVKQEEAILRRLSLEEAHGYYQVLRRRVRRVRILRAITMVSLLLVMVAVRRRFFPPPPPPGDSAVETAPAPAAPVPAPPAR